MFNLFTVFTYGYSDIWCFFFAVQIISSLNRCEQLGSFSHEGLNTLKLLKKR